MAEKQSVGGAGRQHWPETSTVNKMNFSGDVGRLGTPGYSQADGGTIHNLQTLQADDLHCSRQLAAFSSCLQAAEHGRYSTFLLGTCSNLTSEPGAAALCAVELGTRAPARALSWSFGTGNLVSMDS